MAMDIAELDEKRASTVFLNAFKYRQLTLDKRGKNIPTWWKLKAVTIGPWRTRSLINDPFPFNQSIASTRKQQPLHVPIQRDIVPGVYFDAIRFSYERSIRILAPLINLAGFIPAVGDIVQESIRLERLSHSVKTPASRVFKVETGSGSICPILSIVLKPTCDYSLMFEVTLECVVRQAKLPRLGVVGQQALRN
jgi:hypothetical protein